MHDSRNGRADRAAGHPESAPATAFVDELVTSLPALQRWASSLAGRGEDARDLASETVATALAAGDTFDEQRALLPWLFRIAYRQHHRSLRQGTQDEARALAAHRLACASPIESGDPAEVVERREVQQQVRDALGRVSERHQAILLMVGAGGVTR